MDSRDDENDIRADEPIDKELLEARKRKLEEKLEERGLIVRNEPAETNVKKDSRRA